MNALVTGGTGFIGSRHIINLVSNDINVRLLSRRKVEGFETVICDFQSDPIPNDALLGIDMVFHIAGFSHDMRDANQIKDLYQRVNVDVTVALAKLAVKSGVKKFIFVSSVKAGGNPAFGMCASESEQGDLEGVYGKTKREAELQLLKINKESGMHVSIIRPSLVYGPNVKGNLQVMLAGIKKGWFPPLPETGNTRSMIHVDDLVRAISLVADDDCANGEIFIATDGVLYSSRDIYNTMCNVLGKSIPKWSVPKVLFDMTSLIN